MYLEFFGFNKLPFSIAPDPSFLFLGERHREALAHLRHGLSGSGGFLLLTGEVGLGKTTLSRAVLAEFGTQLRVTHILNPRLGEREMLLAIAEGFGLNVANVSQSLKDITDQLAHFMQASAQQNIHPVVVIDEAQHLLPSVLEQLRLLTNLETDSRKLLSVVLIGQPELKTLLQRNELRQVAQRIVARYQLMPFSQTEVNAYIDHRLTTVGGSPAQFTQAARKLIWQYTRGTPRLINLLSDRALQVAAQRNKPQVDPGCVKAATDVLPEEIQHARFGWQGFKLPAVAAAVAIVLWGLYAWQGESWQSREVIGAAEPDTVPAESTVASHTLQVEGVALSAALSELLSIWQAQSIPVNATVCQTIQEVNLYCLRAPLTAEQLSALNHPALVQTRAHGEEKYLLLAKITDEHWHVVDKNGIAELSRTQFEQAYEGNALIIFNLPEAYRTPAGVSWRNWLQERLQSLVPISLRQAGFDRQRDWVQQRLLSTTADDSWLLALLARAQPTQEIPQLRSAAALTLETELVFARWQEQGLGRALQAESNESAVLFPTPSIHLAALDIPELQLSWPVTETVAQSTPSQPNPPAEVNTQSEEEAEVSEALQLLFDDAVRSTPEIRPEAETRYETDPRATQQQPQAVRQSDGPLPTLNELSAQTRQLLPALSYDAHVYQSFARERFVEFDQRRLREGDAFNGLRVISIQPGYTILDANGVLFRLEALESIEN